MRFVMSVVALLVAASGCAVASPDGKRVAMLGTVNTNPYIAAWTSTFIKVDTPLGMKVTFFSSPYDAALQSQQIDDAIAQKFDLIAIAYINDQAIVPAFTRAKAAGIPVVLWGTPIKKDYEDLYLSYIGYDHDALGRFAGEALVKALAEEGKTKAQVAAVTGLAQQLQVQMRLAGFKAVLAQHPGIKLVAEEDGKWNTALSEKIAGEMLVRFNGRGGLDAIFATADNQATGVIQAVESAGLPVGVANKGVVVVASNCMKDGIIHIKSGQQYSTATQIPTVEAEIAAKKIAGYFNGEPLKKEELVTAYGVTKANVEQFATPCSY